MALYSLQNTSSWCSKWYLQILEKLLELTEPHSVLLPLKWGWVHLPWSFVRSEYVKGFTCSKRSTNGSHSYYRYLHHYVHFVRHILASGLSEWVTESGCEHRSFSFQSSCSSLSIITSSIEAEHTKLGREKSIEWGLERWFAFVAF